MCIRDSYYSLEYGQELSEGKLLDLLWLHISPHLETKYAEELAIDQLNDSVGDENATNILYAPFTFLARHTLFESNLVRQKTINYYNEVVKGGQLTAAEMEQFKAAVIEEANRRYSSATGVPATEVRWTRATKKHESREVSKTLPWYKFVKQHGLQGEITVDIRNPPPSHNPDRFGSRGMARRTYNFENINEAVAEREDIQSRKDELLKERRIAMQKAWVAFDKRSDYDEHLGGKARKKARRAKKALEEETEHSIDASTKAMADMEALELTKEEQGIQQGLREALADIDRDEERKVTKAKEKYASDAQSRRMAKQRAEEASETLEKLNAKRDELAQELRSTDSKDAKATKDVADRLEDVRGRIAVATEILEDYTMHGTQPLSEILHDIEMAAKKDRRLSLIHI